MVSWCWPVSLVLWLAHLWQFWFFGERAGLRRRPGAAMKVGTRSDLQAVGQERISILKVDVEGAEAVIFSENYKSWREKVDAIAIELHDDLVFGNATQIFFNAIEGRDLLSRSGELTVCRKAG